MEVREILEGMLDILHEKEWIKHHLYKAGGEYYDEHFWPFLPEGVCLEGACNLVTWNAPQHHLMPLRQQVNDVIMEAAAESSPEKFRDWMTCMFQFNDLDETGREDVILAVKTAIANLENDGNS